MPSNTYDEGGWYYASGIGWVQDNSKKLIQEQPKPVKNESKPIVELVVGDLKLRMAKGIETYGCALQANNGRDAMQDLYEELLDACCYLKQHMEERNAIHNR